MLLFPRPKWARLPPSPMSPTKRRAFPAKAITTRPSPFAARPYRNGPTSLPFSLVSATPSQTKALTPKRSKTTKKPGYRQLLAVTLANLSSVYMVLNKLDDAERCADGAIRTLPDFTPAYITKGVVLETRGQLDPAIENYRKALALSPKSAAAAQNLGAA